MAKSNTKPDGRPKILTSPIIWLWFKYMYQNGTLMNGTKDKHPRFGLSSSILSHAYAQARAPAPRGARKAALTARSLADRRVEPSRPLLVSVWLNIGGFHRSQLGSLHSAGYDISRRAPRVVRARFDLVGSRWAGICRGRRYAVQVPGSSFCSQSGLCWTPRLVGFSIQGALRNTMTCFLSSPRYPSKGGYGPANAWDWNSWDSSWSAGKGTGSLEHGSFRCGGVVPFLARNLRVSRWPAEILFACISNEGKQSFKKGAGSLCFRVCCLQ